MAVDKNKLDEFVRSMQALDGDTIRQPGQPDLRLEGVNASEVAHQDQPAQVGSGIQRDALQAFVDSHQNLVREVSGIAGSRNPDLPDRELGDLRPAAGGESATEYLLRRGMVAAGPVAKDDRQYAAMKGEDVMQMFGGVWMQADEQARRDALHSIQRVDLGAALDKQNQKALEARDGLPWHRSEFEKGVDVGVNTTKQAFHGLSALVSDALGDQEGMLESLRKLEHSKDVGELLGAPRVSRVEDISSVSDFFDWSAGALGQGLVSTAPSLAAGLGTGGIGTVALRVAANRAEKAAIKAAEKRLASVLLPGDELTGTAMRTAVAEAAKRQGGINALQTLARFKHAPTAAAATGAFGVSAGVESGSIYDELNARGLADWKTALGYGAAAGALDVAGLAFAVSRVLPGANEVARDGIVRLLSSGVMKDFAKTAVAEGGTEGLQELIHAAAILHEDPTFDLSSPDVRSQILNAMAMGALTGGVMGGSARVAGNVATAVTRPRQQDSGIPAAPSNPPAAPGAPPEAVPTVAAGATASVVTPTNGANQPTNGAEVGAPGGAEVAPTLVEPGPAQSGADATPTGGASVDLPAGSEAAPAVAPAEFPAYEQWLQQEYETIKSRANGAPVRDAADNSVVFEAEYLRFNKMSEAERARWVEQKTARLASAQANGFTNTARAIKQELDILTGVAPYKPLNKARYVRAKQAAKQEAALAATTAPTATPAATSAAAPTVEFRQRITRGMLRAEPNTVFLFGDNLTGRGLGGQAKEMRGEPNAIGVPTKKAPHMGDSAFFTDAEYDANVQAIDAALAKIPNGAKVVIPSSGLGTGLAQLAERAPRTAAYLEQRLAELSSRSAIPTDAPAAMPAATPAEAAPRPLVAQSAEGSVDVAALQEYADKLLRLLGLREVSVISASFAASMPEQFLSDEIGAGAAFDVRTRMRQLADSSSSALSSVFPEQRILVVNDRALSGIPLPAQYEVVAHEIGHLVELDLFESAPQAVKNAVMAEYQRYVDSANTARGVIAGKLPASFAERQRTALQSRGRSEDAPVRAIFGRADYQLSFTEWHADQVARWAMTSAAPKSLLERYFARVAEAVKKLYAAFKDSEYRPASSLAQFLDGVAKTVAEQQRLEAPTVAYSGSDLEAVIDSSGHDVKVVLEHIANNSGSARYRELAKALLHTMDARGFYPALVTSARPGFDRLPDSLRRFYEETTAGMYVDRLNNGRGAIFLRRNGETRAPGTQEEVVLHEGLHAVLARVYNNPQTAQERAAVAQINSIVSHLRGMERPSDVPEAIWRHITGDHAGHELITMVLTNATTYAALSRIEVAANESALERFIRAILKMLSPIFGAAKASATAARAVEDAVRTLIREGHTVVAPVDANLYAPAESGEFMAAKEHTIAKFSRNSKGLKPSGEVALLVDGGLRKLSDPATAQYAARLIARDPNATVRLVALPAQDTRAGAARLFMVNRAMQESVASAPIPLRSVFNPTASAEAVSDADAAYEINNELVEPEVPTELNAADADENADVVADDSTEQLFDRDAKETQQPDEVKAEERAKAISASLSKIYATARQWGREIKGNERLFVPLVIPAVQEKNGELGMTTGTVVYVLASEVRNLGQQVRTLVEGETYAGAATQSEDLFLFNLGMRALTDESLWPRRPATKADLALFPELALMRYDGKAGHYVNSADDAVMITPPLRVTYQHSKSERRTIHVRPAIETDETYAGIRDKVVRFGEGGGRNLNKPENANTVELETTIAQAEGVRAAVSDDVTSADRTRTPIEEAENMLLALESASPHPAIEAVLYNLRAGKRFSALLDAMKNAGLAEPKTAKEFSAAVNSLSASAGKSVGEFASSLGFSGRESMIRIFNTMRDVKGAKLSAAVARETKQLPLLKDAPAAVRTGIAAASAVAANVGRPGVHYQRVNNKADRIVSPDDAIEVANNSGVGGFAARAVAQDDMMGYVAPSDLNDIEHDDGPLTRDPTGAEISYSKASPDVVAARKKRAREAAAAAGNARVRVNISNGVLNHLFGDAIVQFTEFLYDLAPLKVDTEVMTFEELVGELSILARTHKGGEVRTWATSTLRSLQLTGKAGVVIYNPHTGKAYIGLGEDAFADVQSSAFVLAHEIGHLIERQMIEPFLTLLPTKDGHVDVANLRGAYTRASNRQRQLGEPGASVAEWLRETYKLEPHFARVLAGFMESGNTEPFAEWMANQWAQYILTRKGVAERTGTVGRTPTFARRFFSEAYTSLANFATKVARMLGMTEKSKVETFVEDYFDALILRKHDGALAVVSPGHTVSPLAFSDANSIPLTGQVRLTAFGPMYITSKEAREQASSDLTNFLSRVSANSRLVQAVKPRVSPFMRNLMTATKEGLSKLVLWNTAYIKSMPNLTGKLRAIVEIFDSGQFHQYWTSTRTRFMESYYNAVANLTAEQKDEVYRLLINQNEVDPTGQDPVSVAVRAIKANNKEIYAQAALIISESGGKQFLEEQFVFDPKYGVQRVWNPEAILADEAGFYKMMQANGIDMTSLAEFMERVREGHVTESSYDDLTVHPGTAGSMRGKQFPRVLKGAEPFLNPSLDVVMGSYISQMTKTMALARFFGGSHTFKDGATEVSKEYWWPTAKINVALNEAKNPGLNAPREGAQLLGMRRKDVEYLATKAFPALLGRLGQDIHPDLRKFITRTQAILNVLLLPFSTLASFPDMAGVMLRARDLQMTTDMFKEYFSGLSREQMIEEAKLLGFVTSEAMDEFLANMYNDGLQGDAFATKLNHKLFSWNQQARYTKFTRVLATAVGRRWLAQRHQMLAAGGEQAAKALEELSEIMPYKTSSGTMTDAAQKYTEAEARAALDLWAEHGYSAVALHEAAKSAVLDLGGDAVRAAALTAADRAVQDMLGVFVNQSILNPHAADRPVWASDPKFALFFHLKQFAYSFHKVILTRFGDEFLKAYATTDWKYAAQTAAYLAPMLALAAAGLVIRNVLQYSVLGMGEEPPEQRTPEGGWDYIVQLLQRAGVFGLFQFAIDVEGQAEQGNFWPAALFGPAVGRVSDIITASAADEDKWAAGLSNELAKFFPPFSWSSPLRQNALDALPGE